MGACRAFGALVVVVVAGCSDPSFDVEIVFHEADGGVGPTLEEKTATLTVAVLDADAVTAAAAPQMPQDNVTACDAIAYQLVSAEVLTGARQASVVARTDARLSGVPRLGAKVVFVEALDGSGRRIGAGCTPWGDVSGDVRVPVLVEPAPRVRPLGLSTPGREPEVIDLLLTAAWDDLVPLSGHPVWAEIHDGIGMLKSSTLTTESDGSVEAPGIATAELSVEGPIQTVVRARWAESPIRVPWFHGWPFPSFPKNGSFSFDDAAPWITGTTQAWSMPGGAPWWVAATIDGGQVAAVYTTPAMPNQLNVVRVSPQTPDPVNAIAIHPQHGVVTLLTNGWNRINQDGTVQLLAPFPDPTPVTEIHVVTPCPDELAGPSGVLVRRAAEPYETIAWVTDPSNEALAALLGKLSENGVRLDIIDQVCVTTEPDTDPDPDVYPAPRRHLIARGLTGLWLVGQDARIRLPASDAVTAFEDEGHRWSLAGVVATLTGAHAQSYRRVAAPLGYVADGVLDRGLAAAPTSMLVFPDPCRVGELRAVAAMPASTGVRLQVSAPIEVAGEPLTGISAAIPFTRRGAGDAVLRLENVDLDGNGTRELVVSTSVSLDVYRIPAMPCARSMKSKN